MLQLDDKIKIIIKWWRLLQPNHDTGFSGDRGALARLRRCHNIMDVFFESAFQNLLNDLGADLKTNDDMQVIALVALVIANVRNDKGIKGEKVAHQAGKGKDENILYKPLRFKKLIQARTVDECQNSFRRLVKILKGDVNLYDLIKGILNWPYQDHKNYERAEHIRMEWIRSYWNDGG